ncbi:hypothetical protein AVS7_01757 [Acidovorax sp. MR-S7]|nr:hypothetical protein AVS7_01757 [Acidovorax sp. MR-S7]
MRGHRPRDREKLAVRASRYLWAYATGAFENIKAVVYDFCESRSGEHARRFLGDWRGSLTCDDFSGYKALIASGVTEVGCLAHARRKFFDLHAANRPQQYQRGGWIQYVMTQSGPEPLEALHSRIDYEHYLVKQLQPIADVILQPLGDSFVALTSAQKVLF